MCTEWRSIDYIYTRSTLFCHNMSTYERVLKLLINAAAWRAVPSSMRGNTCPVEPQPHVRTRIGRGGEVVVLVHLKNLELTERRDLSCDRLVVQSYVCRSSTVTVYPVRVRARPWRGARPARDDRPGAVKRRGRRAENERAKPPAGRVNRHARMHAMRSALALCLSLHHPQENARPGHPSISHAQHRDRAGRRRRSGFVY